MVDLQSKMRTLIFLLSSQVKSNAFLKGTFQVSSMSSQCINVRSEKNPVFDLAQMCKNSILSPLKTEVTIHSPSFPFPLI